MPTLFFLLSTCCTPLASGNDEDALSSSQDTAAQVQQQVQEVSAQIDEQAARLAALERYLSDKERAASGEAPRGWVQPSLEEYLKPGAPASFIQVPVVAEAPKTTVGPKGPQP